MLTALTFVACLYFGGCEPPPEPIVHREWWCQEYNCEVITTTPVIVSTTTTQPKVYSGMGTNVEQWRGLVSAYFTQVDLALCVMSGESGGNPNAYNPSGASGLFQVMDWWAPEFGYTATDLFDPEVNTYVASQILAIQGWTAWAVYNKGMCS